MMRAHGRVLIQPTRKPNIVTDSNGSNTIEREEQFQINPVDAKLLNLRNGQNATIETFDGVTKHGVISYGDSIPTGVISLTTLFGELAVEVDSSTIPDPVNHIKRMNAIPSKIYATDGAINDPRK